MRKNNRQPERDPAIEQAHLVLVGEPQGRSFDPARTESPICKGKSEVIGASPFASNTSLPNG